MNWTQEQQQAIELPVSDMIVSAAAGSGKTAVMAERILRRLTSEDDFVEIDKILVVTYTSAAASEIKERIMKNIMKQLETEKSSRLSNQLLKLPYAHISTIHSFCLDLIRKYFYILDIDPSVKIAEQTDVNVIKKNAVEKVLDKHYSESDNVFHNLVSDYSEKRDNIIGDLIISIYDFSRTMPESNKWLDSLTEAYDGYPDAALDFLVHCSLLAGRLAIMRYDEALALCTQNEGCEIIRNFLSKERNALSQALDTKDYASMKAAFDALEFPNWRGAKGPENVRPFAQKKRDAAKSIITKTIIPKYLRLTKAEILSDNAVVLPYINKFVELAKEFGLAFEEMKREKNIIDFSDFEHLALKLLRNEDGTPSDIALSVSNDFEEIYIDEYQDCNNIQNSIFEYISGSNRNHPNVFCVGDMKQSIYSFRDSNPLLFRDKCDTYPIFDGKTANPSNKILLNKNFRSRETILKFVNSVFSQIMSLDCGELEYNENEMLNYGGGYTDVNKDTENIDIAVIDTSNTFNSYADITGHQTLSALEAEAVYVGEKIKEYISSGYMLYDRKSQSQRPAQYKDIVILLRSVSSPAPIFEKTLSDMGIPVYSDKGTAYFDAEEIRFLISLLKIIDNPDDDISLVATMKNPVFGFDENLLLQIRIAFPDMSFYDCIKSYIRTKNDSLSSKIDEFFKKIDNYYLKSRYMNTDEFLSYIISDLDYYTLLSIYPDSKLKKTNVRFLLKKAREFEKNNFRGIYSFVRFVENFAAENSAESAKILSENDNVVRIMSIHKSKGLEFPIVFLSGLGVKFNTQSQRQKVVIHKQLGIGIECVYRSAGVRFNTANMLAIKQKLAFEAISEELRVLYVALTRPTEKLILTAAVNNGAALVSNAEKAVANEERNINPYLIFSSNCFIDIILYSVVRSAKFPKDFNSSYKCIIDDGCNFSIDLKNISDIQAPKSCSDRVDWHLQNYSPTDAYESVKEALSYNYPHSESIAIPTNLTVTELKKLSFDNDDIYIPFDDVRLAVPSEFGNKGAISGASMGTLVHYVMEKLDFSSVSSENDIKYQLGKLYDDAVLSDDELFAVDTQMIYRFFKSDLGVRMKEKSETLLKEYSFKYLSDASQIFDTSSDDRIVIQGTVDAFFEDDDGNFVVVDYKTDKVIDGNSAVIAERYRAQLEYYARALEVTFGKKVKEKILYLFDTGEAISL